MSNWRRRRLRWIVVGSFAMAMACGVDVEHAREVERDEARGEAYPLVVASPQVSRRERERFTGKFELCSDERATASKEVEAFVDLHYQLRSAGDRKKARESLMTYTTSPYLPERFELIVDDMRQQITMNVERGYWKVSAPSDKNKMTSRPDWEGEMLQVRFYIAKSKDGKATMVQVFRNRKGKRTNRSYIDASGKLILTVKLKSPLLPKPLTYEVTYCRERGS